MGRQTGILGIELFTVEELDNGRIRYGELVKHFNRIYEEYPETFDQFTNVEFHKLSNEQLRSEEWFEFLSDHRVSNILNKILIINMRASINKIMADKEGGKGLAASQKLSASLSFVGKYFDSIVKNDSVTYIYTSVPLTREEEFAKNAKTLVIRPKINPNNPAIPGNKNKASR